MNQSKPIEKLLGMKCISCAHFSCDQFGDIASRLAYGRKQYGGFHFGYCDVLDAHDAVGCHLVKDEKHQNHECDFLSAGSIQC